MPTSAATRSNSELASSRAGLTTRWQGLGTPCLVRRLVDLGIDFYAESHTVSSKKRSDATRANGSQSNDRQADDRYQNGGGR
jgi:hypothetical protein